MLLRSGVALPRNIVVPVGGGGRSVRQVTANGDGLFGEGV